jgi:hypothetical protein
MTQRQTKYMLERLSKLRQDTQNEAASQFLSLRAKELPFYVLNVLCEEGRYGHNSAPVPDPYSKEWVDRYNEALAGIPERDREDLQGFFRSAIQYMNMILKDTNKWGARIARYNKAVDAACDRVTSTIWEVFEDLEGQVVFANHAAEYDTWVSLQEQIKGFQDALQNTIKSELADLGRSRDQILDSDNDTPE